MNFAYRAAVLSEDARYRYCLTRAWTAQPPNRVQFALWVLLNPSTADGSTDDPTVRKAAGFTDRLGYKAMRFVNLYAYRSTIPRGIKVARDPVGPENDSWINSYADDAAVIILAWGQNPLPKSGRPEHVFDMLVGRRSALYCYGANQTGHPCHPLMLPYDTPLRVYKGLEHESRRRTR